MKRTTSALLVAAALLGAPAVSLTPHVAFAAAPAAAASMTPGAIVYDMSGKEIGTVVDVLTNTHNDAYAVLNVKPYVGHDKMVLVPVDHIGGTPDHMTMNVTRSEIMHMAALAYNVPPGGH